MDSTIRVDSGGGVDGTVMGRDANIMPGDCFEVVFGPITVPSGQERTQCVVKLLGNTDPIHVNHIENDLGTSSHHMILYRVADTTEQPDPFDCSPFRETLNPASGSPLVISQTEHDTLDLPPGVGFALDANQMVRMEMHYINTTPAEVTLETTSRVCPMPEADFMYAADFLFVGTPDIDIPPRASHTVGPRYFPIPAEYADAQFFAITGHEHHWGTGVNVWTATSASDPGTLVYDPEPFLWDEPETVYHDPPFRVPAGGGFKFECEWFNDSGSSVGFGESANDEMCFFWAYYFPGVGSKVCFQTDQAGGTTGCCPGHFACGFLL
jgi:hypothetical protein